jgi:hypothetical protein
MTQRDIVATLCTIFFVLLVAVAVRSIKKRAQAQGPLALLDVDSLTGNEIAEASGFYVATTFADAPLSRLADKRLLHRGKARLSVLTDGLIIDRTGEPSIAIQANDIQFVGRASATIDRGVENSGLLAITWTTGTVSLTTNLRLSREDDTQELLDLISKLAKKEAIA